MIKRPPPPKTSQRDNDQSSETPPDYEIGYGRPPCQSAFKFGSDLHLMILSGELAVLQWGN